MWGGEEGSGGTGRSGDPLTAEKRRWHRDPTPQPQPDLKIEPSTSSDLVSATISWRDRPAYLRSSPASPQALFAAFLCLQPYASDPPPLYHAVAVTSAA
ncbi:hypothetical protein VTN00DRAFT_3890 [Thermoascus crustaceus]|uniref:uncharacterized protein n=1 Tax=Thermoascus crustaceus TaxID=5088 RepID=UPI003744A26D